MNLKNEKLERILEKHPATRNNDKVMFIAYLQEYFCDTQEEKDIICKILLKAPNMSTLQRTRAWYQNEIGLYLPPDFIVNKRKKAQDIVKAKIRQAKKDKVGLFSAIARWF